MPGVDDINTEHNQREMRPWAYVGWLLFFGLMALGNTSLGILVLLMDRIAQLVSRIRAAALGSRRDTAFGQTPVPKQPGSLSFSIRRTPTVLCIMFSAVLIVSAALSQYRSHAFLTSMAWFLWWWVVVEGSRELAANDSFFSKRAIPAFYAGAVLSALIALFTYFVLDMPRARTLGSLCNGLGTLMTISILIAAGSAEESRGRWRLVYMAGIPLMLGALLVSFSRGAWLGLTAGMIVYALNNRKRMIVLLGLLLVLGAVVASYDPLTSRFLSIFDLDRNSDRLTIWTTTLAMIRDHPVLGVGPGLYPFHYQEYRGPDAPENTIPFAHNLPLQVMAESGMLGLLSFGALIVYVMYCGIRLAASGRPLYRALFAALVGVLVHELFDNDILGVNIGGAFWVICGLLVWSYELEYLSDQPVRGAGTSHSLDAGSGHS